MSRPFSSSVYPNAFANHTDVADRILRQQGALMATGDKVDVVCMGGADQLILCTGTIIRISGQGNFDILYDGIRHGKVDFAATIVQYDREDAVARWRVALAPESSNDAVASKAAVCHQKSRGSHKSHGWGSYLRTFNTRRRRGDGLRQ